MVSELCFLEQVTWAGFGILELGQHIIRHVLLLGYQNGFQVFDVEDASNFNELVSKHGGPVSFLQMQPLPARSGDHEGFRNSHPLLLVVAGDDTTGTGSGHSFSHNGADSSGDDITYPTTVRFYSLRSHSYVYVLRFRSYVCTIRCSSRVVAVGLATQVSISVLQDIQIRVIKLFYADIISSCLIGMVRDWYLVLRPNKPLNVASTVRV